VVYSLDILHPDYKGALRGVCNTRRRLSANIPINLNGRCSIGSGDVWFWNLPTFVMGTQFWTQLCL